MQRYADFGTIDIFKIVIKGLELIRKMFNVHDRAIRIGNFANLSLYSRPLYFHPSKQT
jgi:hypothetical protein